MEADRSWFTSDGIDSVELHVYGDGKLLYSGYEIYYTRWDSPYYRADSNIFRAKYDGYYYIHAV